MAFFQCKKQRNINGRTVTTSLENTTQSTFDGYNDQAISMTLDLLCLAQDKTPLNTLQWGLFF